jgi:signal transduction histidine kinase
VKISVSYVGEDLDAFFQDFHIIADRNKLNQIMRNLISNGLKFTPKGGTINVVTKVIDITNTDTNKRNNNNHNSLENIQNMIKKFMLCIDVIDSGVGISLV